MPFSHHSHSGEFCPGHAQDTLEDVIKTAISKEFLVFALTEHMPRHDQDRYPEEIEAGSTLASLTRNEANYFEKAQELRLKYEGTISLPVGFETDWCGRHSLELIQKSLQAHAYDFFIGSIHHFRGIPIDYDQAEYDRAKAVAGGTDEKLFEAYFDEQLEMLEALRPPVVGHIDLIRLKSRDFNVNWRSMEGVWSRIIRNLNFVASYGGILEINTAALRKGMREPYPSSDICQEFLQLDGRFCLSDDSHGIEQVATNYNKLIPFLQRNGIEKLSYLTYSANSENSSDPRFRNLLIRSISVCDIASHRTLKAV